MIATWITRLRPYMMDVLELAGPGNQHVVLVVIVLLLVIFGFFLTR